jgi:KinB signaling pathway activation protein
MNLRRFFALFFSTALVGLLLGLLTTLSGQFGVRVVVGIIAGGFLSATCLMGFWAYLTLNFTMRSCLSFRLWVMIQGLLVAIVFYDLVYFRWVAAGETGSLLPYLLYALWPFGIALIGALAKAKVSGMRSFVPALFFLFVFTAIEWFIALKSGELLQTTQIGIILLGCNLYILMMYTRLLKQPAPSR